MLPVLHLVVVCAYAGFQWTVRVLVYPQFAEVGTSAFADYERCHQTRVSRLAGPLFAGQAVTTGWLLLSRPAGTPAGRVVAAAVLLAGVLLVTALGAVPQHRRLSSGWDAAAHRRLLRVDGVRVALATANGVVAVLLLR